MGPMAPSSGPKPFPSDHQFQVQDPHKHGGPKISQRSPNHPGVVSGVKGIIQQDVRSHKDPANSIKQTLHQGGPKGTPGAMRQPWVAQASGSSNEWTQAGHSSYARVTASSERPVSELEKQYLALAKQAKSDPKVLRIKFEKPPSAGAEGVSQVMDQTEWADLFFEQIGLSPSDVIGVDLEPGSQHDCEIMLSKAAKVEDYKGKNGQTKGLSFRVSAAEPQEMEVIFKGIPLSVPDIEILHLVKCYGGKMKDERVVHKPMLLATSNGKVKVESQMSTTRSVKASFPDNKTLRCFYWFQGLMPGDTMRRVVVETNQKRTKQCGNCLMSPNESQNPCPFNGKTSACKKHNLAGRTSVTKYLRFLKEADNYISLRQLTMRATPPASLGGLSVEEEEEEEEESRKEKEEEERGKDKEEKEEVEEKEETVEMKTRVLKPRGYESTPGHNPGSLWADEVITFSPEKDREQMIQQIADLQKQVSDKEAMLQTERKVNKKQLSRLTQANREASEGRLGIKSSRNFCIDRIGQLLPAKSSEWQDNRPHLASLLAATAKLSHFNLEKGVVTAKKEAWADISAKANTDSERARVEEIIKEAEHQVRVRKLTQSSIRSRSMSRSRVSDSEDDDKAAKVAKIVAPHKEVNEKAILHKDDTEEQEAAKNVKGNEEKESMENEVKEKEVKKEGKTNKDVGEEEIPHMAEKDEKEEEKKPKDKEVDKKMEKADKEKEEKKEEKREKKKENDEMEEKTDNEKEADKKNEEMKEDKRERKEDKVEMEEKVEKEKEFDSVEAHEDVDDVMANPEQGKNAKEKKDEAKSQKLTSPNKSKSAKRNSKLIEPSQFPKEGWGSFENQKALTKKGKVGIDKELSTRKGKSATKSDKVASPKS